jgi:hypothetical protein
VAVTVGGTRGATGVIGSAAAGRAGAGVTATDARPAAAPDDTRTGPVLTTSGAGLVAGFAAGLAAGLDGALVDDDGFAVVVDAPEPVEPPADALPAPAVTPASSVGADDPVTAEPPDAAGRDGVPDVSTAAAP